MQPKLELEKKESKIKEQFILTTVNSMTEHIHRYNRNPTLHIIVLYANDPKVRKYALDIQEMFVKNGIDIYLHIELDFSGYIRPENLAQIITSTSFDFLIVIGNKNMKNQSCHAKKKGKLVEMKVDEIIESIWNDWNSSKAIVDDEFGFPTVPENEDINEIELTNECLLNLLYHHTQLRRISERIQKFATVISKSDEFNQEQNDLLDKYAIHLYELLVIGKQQIQLIPEEQQDKLDMRNERGKLINSKFIPINSRPLIPKQYKNKLLNFCDSLISTIGSYSQKTKSFNLSLWKQYLADFNDKKLIDSNKFQDFYFEYFLPSEDAFSTLLKEESTNENKVSGNTTLLHKETKQTRNKPKIKQQKSKQQQSPNQPMQNQLQNSMQNQLQNPMQNQLQNQESQKIQQSEHLHRINQYEPQFSSGQRISSFPSLSLHQHHDGFDSDYQYMSSLYRVSSHPSINQENSGFYSKNSQNSQNSWQNNSHFRLYEFNPSDSNYNSFNRNYNDGFQANSNINGYSDSIKSQQNISDQIYRNNLSQRKGLNWQNSQDQF
ncbi:hypothetical protein M0811_02022 [Anaeramoeba ignava]|uniref:Uncharacterized protein n=1 Tax=Anaeramoeba ignava TaxID=1746090 RepID=A0A9Q0LFS0_ANAIG|nr:hypothetical protein M0811_02022 [Anaeramoeba ignava]